MTYYTGIAHCRGRGGRHGDRRVKRNHHSVGCGNQIVPELVSGQIQGGLAMGIGHHALYELPLYEGGPATAPGTGTAIGCRVRPRRRRLDADRGRTAAAVETDDLQGAWRR